jgi:hypothetical protein
LDRGQIEIFFDQVTIDRSQHFSKAHDFGSGKYVYLNLGARVEGRRWMVGRFGELEKVNS